MLTKEEKSRYQKHIFLPEIGLSGQERLKQAKVLVVGAGGLGSPVLQYLSAAGIGTIGIIDGDKVELSILVQIKQVSLPKT
jgi:molybdopterin/thiamine biosynthesis adenylyltransferase